MLCEKSLACNAAEAEDMNRAARHAGLVLMDAFHYRYHPLFARVKSIYDSGELGEITGIDAAFAVPIRGEDNIRMNYALGGGVTMDIGCYPIHWVRHLTGREPTVCSVKVEVGPPDVDVLLEADMEITGIPVRTSGDMRARSGFTAELVVTGSRGRMHVSNLIAPQMGHLLTVTVGGSTREETLDRRPTYAYQLDAFIDAVENGADIPTDGDDAVNQMRVIDRCYELAGLPLRGLQR